MKRTKLLVLLAVAAILAVAAGCSWSTVASVNGARITEKEFYSRLADQHGREVLENMVVEKIVMQEAATRKITVTDKELSDELSRIKGTFPSEEKFAEALKQYYGMTEDMLKDRIKLDKLAGKLRTADVKVSDAEVNGFIKDRRYLRHILVAEESDAKGILQLVKSGSSFEDLAKARSNDPGSKTRGGLLGFVKKGDMVPEFEKAAFALKEGETSGVVKTPYGFHIIKSEKPDRNEAIETLKKEKAEPVDQWIARLRQNARIDIKMAKYKDLAEQMKKPAQENNPAMQTPPAGN